MPGGEKPVSNYAAKAAQFRQAALQQQENEKAQLIENRTGGGGAGGSGNTKTLTQDDFDRGVDMGISSSQLLDPLTDTNKLFAENQSGLSQINAAVTGGILKGGLTLIESAGYLTDVKGMLDSTDTMDNWLSQLARDGKGWIDNELPIYRESPSEVWDLDDPAWYAQQAQGVIDSGIGFGLLGLGAGAIVGKIAGGLARATAMSEIGRAHV